MIHWENQIHSLRDYGILFFLLAVSLALLNLNSNPQIRWFHAASIGLVGSLQNSLTFYEKYVRLEHENERLRKRLANLSLENSFMKEAYLNNVRLEKMLGFKKRARDPLVVARVIGRGASDFSQAVLIDAGKDRRIEENMPVITDAGLVGKIAMVGPHTSVVQLIGDLNFRASAMVQRSRVLGIFAPAHLKKFQLNNVPVQADIKPGDVVITSGYSNTFPKGIRIGVVSQVSERKNKLLKTVEVQPAVDPQEVEDVFVIIKKRQQ